AGRPASPDSGMGSLASSQWAASGERVPGRCGTIGAGNRLEEMTMAVSSKPERVLARAKNLLANRGWTQGVFARDKNGREVSAGDSKATRFCINGAIDRACRGIKNGSARAAAWSK